MSSEFSSISYLLLGLLKRNYRLTQCVFLQETHRYIFIYFYNMYIYNYKVYIFIYVAYVYNYIYNTQQINPVS